MNDLISLPKCEITAVGLRFEPGMSFEDWVASGRRLLGLKEAIQWLIGDWVLFGEEHYLEEGSPARVKYRAAMQMFGEKYEVQTIRSFVYVCRRFEMLRRRNKLWFSHHREAAPLEVKKQDRYLKMAEEQCLSVADLRELIYLEESGTDPSQELARPTPSAFARLNWLNLFFKREDPEKWSDARLESTDKELAPLVEFHARIRKIRGQRYIGSD